METNFKELKKITIKLEKRLIRRNFLEDCKYFNIIPKFLRITNKLLWKEHKKDVLNFEKTLLNRVIRRTYSEIKNLTEKHSNIERKYRQNHGEEYLKNDYERLEYFKEKERNKYGRKQSKKLQSWIKQRKKNVETNKEREKRIPYENKSTMELNSHQKEVLKLGPKYILQDKINMYDTIPHIEKALSILPEKHQNRIRSKVQDELKKINPDKNDVEDVKTIKNLKKNKEIACIQSDKTGKIIIMDRTEYIEKMETEIERMNITKLEKDPNKKFNEKVKKLIKNGKWPEEEKPYIKNHAPNTPRAFGKLKDHKSPPTMRVIVNRKEGPSYVLEKAMTNIYRKLTPPTDCSLTSTEEFIQKIREIKIDEEIKMVSFDIKNLYPSINIIEINEIINREIQKVYKDMEIVTTLQATTNLLLNESFFRYNNKFYKQKTGVPMGSPISGVIAEWKIRILENEIKTKFKENIKFWVRYVDDIFAIIKTNTNENDLLENLNELDNNIKFTMETEDKNIINYLDVKIEKTERKFETTIYRKKEANIDIIHARCKTPYAYKLAALRSYINRAIIVCSNKILLKEELMKIEEIAIENGYRKDLVQQIYRKRIKTLNNIPSAQKQRLKFTTPIPYLGKSTEIIKKEAKKINYHIPIKPSPNIMQQIKSDRDELDPLETAGIYKIDYQDEENTKKCYIGLTKRKIKERIGEHQRDIRYQKQTTALAREALNQRIKINFENTRKIANYNNSEYGFVREALEIKKHRNSACNDVTHRVIDRAWDDLLRMPEKRKMREEKSETDEENTTNS